MTTRVSVVAAVVERDGRFLLGRRPLEKRHGGLWEFPGGKVDADESPSAAARRELAEELALEVTAVGERLHEVVDSASPFVIEFYPVTVVGRPAPLEHIEVGWFTLQQLDRMDLAPADERFARWLSARPRAP